MTFTSNYKPFMAYLEPNEITKLKHFAKAHKVPMAQIIREAIYARLASGDQYTSGFNDGLAKAKVAVSGVEAAQMRFPSGMTVADLINSEISKHTIHEAAASESDKKLKVKSKPKS